MFSTTQPYDSGSQAQEPGSSFSLLPPLPHQEDQEEQEGQERQEGLRL